MDDGPEQWARHAARRASCGISRGSVVPVRAANDACASGGPARALEVAATTALSIYKPAGALRSRR
jgi:hypothetical protein